MFPGGAAVHVTLTLEPVASEIATPLGAEGAREKIYRLMELVMKYVSMYHLVVLITTISSCFNHLDYNNFTTIFTPKYQTR